MKESDSIQVSNERVQSKEMAEILAHIEEDYNRIGTMKELLGIASEGDDIEIKAQIIKDTEDNLIQNGGSLPGEMNGPKNELGQQRHEVVRAIESNMQQNLTEGGATLDERGDVVSDQSTSAEVADASNRIISGVNHLINRATSSRFDSHPPLEVKVLSIDSKTSEKDAATQWGATTIALKALGLSSDQVNGTPFEATGVTSAGWSSETKLLPTDVPGVMYKEVLYHAPEGSDEQPVRHASLELSTEVTA